MSNNNSSSGGIGFCGLLTIAFVVLKLTKFIDWSWWWVISPIWIPFTIVIIILPFYLYAKYKEAKDELNRAESGYNKVGWRNGGKSKWQERMEQAQQAKNKA